jgi:hypothetical protein
MRKMLPIISTSLLIASSRLAYYEINQTRVEHWKCIGDGNVEHTFCSVWFRLSYSTRNVFQDIIILQYQIGRKTNYNSYFCIAILHGSMDIR